MQDMLPNLCLMLFNSWWDSGCIGENNGDIGDNRDSVENGDSVDNCESAIYGDRGHIVLWRF